MRLIIAGSRNIDLCNLEIRDLVNAITNYRQPSEVVSGGARGIDEYGEDYGHNNGIPVKVFEANWEEKGRAAGPIRNKEMAEYSDALLLIWDGQSKGSASMKKEMLKLNKPVYEIILRKHNV
jgi:hypothetical protein